MKAYTILAVVDLLTVKCFGYYGFLTTDTFFHSTTTLPADHFMLTRVESDITRCIRTNHTICVWRRSYNWGWCWRINCFRRSPFIQRAFIYIGLEALHWSEKKIKDVISLRVNRGSTRCVSQWFRIGYRSRHPLITPELFGQSSWNFCQTAFTIWISWYKF